MILIILISISSFHHKIKEDEIIRSNIIFAYSKIDKEGYE